MTNAQWTVLGLIIVIVGLEALRKQGVRDWFKAIYAHFNINVNSAKGG